MTLNTEDKQVFHTQRLTASSHISGVILNTQWPNVTANSLYMEIQTNVANSREHFSLCTFQMWTI